MKTEALNLNTEAANLSQKLGISETDARKMVILTAAAVLEAAGAKTQADKLVAGFFGTRRDVCTARLTVRR